MLQSNLFKLIRTGFLAAGLTIPLAMPALAQSNSTSSTSTGQSGSTTSRQSTRTNSRQNTGSSMQGTGNSNTANNPPTGTAGGVVPGTGGSGDGTGPYGEVSPSNEPTGTTNNAQYANEHHTDWGWLGLLGLFGLTGLLRRRPVETVQRHDIRSEPHMTRS